MPAADATPHPSRIITFRNAFLSGALLLAPMVVTVWAFLKIIDLLGGTFRPFYQDHLPEQLQRVPFLWDFLTSLVVILLITSFGYLSHYLLGKYFVSLTERAINRLPGLGAVYSSVKQIVSTFSTQNRNLFSKVVMVQFPRPGLWSIGFLTNKTQAEPHSHIGPDTWTVFVPTSPNPTSGFLLIVPRSDVVELDMSVGDGMKFVISGGAVTPPWPPTTPADPEI